MRYFLLLLCFAPLGACAQDADTTSFEARTQQKSDELLMFVNDFEVAVSDQLVLDKGSWNGISLYRLMPGSELSLEVKDGEKTVFSTTMAATDYGHIYVDFVLTNKKADRVATLSYTTNSGKEVTRQVAITIR